MTFSRFIEVAVTTVLAFGPSPINITDALARNWVTSAAANAIAAAIGAATVAQVKKAKRATAGTFRSVDPDFAGTDSVF